MYDLKTLLNLSAKPTIADVDISLLQELYEAILLPYTYKFRLSDDNEVKLNFDQDKFCHLIGLGTMIKKINAGSTKLEDFSGFKGWKNIKAGLINNESMKNLVGKKHFNNGKDKLIFFYNIPRLLDSSNSMIKYRKIPSSNIVYELMIYNVFDNAYVHLGIEKEDHGKSYYPRSFWMERKTRNSSGDRFMKDQHHLTILSRNKLLR